eukprot:scaffold38992_cov176-Amphora_coffeaeformis.AAC.1
MPLAYTVQDPFQWENYSKVNMNEPDRRSSLIAARRNSLLSALSVFEFSVLPSFSSRTEHHEDVDPFAPLSIDDGYHSKSFAKRPLGTLNAAYGHVLTDRSESSGATAPSMTSSHGSESAAPVYPSHPGNSLFFQDGINPNHPAFDEAPFDAFSSSTPALTSSFSSNVDEYALGEVEGEAEGENEDALDSQRFKRFHEEKWSHRYKELLAFHREFGHSAVPHTFPRNPQLARWVKRQRRQYKLRCDSRPSTMTLERLEMLDSVGFVWDSHDVNWREKLTALDDFRREHGHCNVPSNYTDKKLATWVKCQRRQYKLHIDQKPSAMTEQRIAELEKRGFEWEIRSTAGKVKPATVSDFAPCSY